MAIQESCYIGGPMRGIRRFNFDAFDSMNLWLQNNRRWQIHNPATHDRQEWPDIETWEGFEDGDTDRCPKFDLSQALSWDLARVAESQHLVLLPGWEQSTGARHERHVAELTGSSIWIAQPALTVDAWHLRLDMSREGSLQPTPTPVTSGGSMMKMNDPYQAHDTFMGKPVDPRTLIGDDGERPAKRTFDTGATRDLSDHKPDYEGFLSVTAFRAYGRYMLGHRKMADGSLRDSDNWQKGIPIDAYMKSLFRHTIDVWDLHRQGDTLLDYDGVTPVTLEEALCGVIFNAFGYLHEVTKRSVMETD